MQIKPGSLGSCCQLLLSIPMKTRLVLFLFCSVCFVFIAAAQDVSLDFPVRKLLEPYVESGEIPGAVTVIATKDKILQIDCVGYADLETKCPMTSETVFWMASQTKTVTAVAVMLLIEEGKLSLDEPITKYIPELSALQVVAEKTDDKTVLVPVDKSITLRMLLSHTAGTCYLSPMQLRHGIDCLPTEKALTIYVMTPLAHQPGTKFLYSNIGINIAATAIERVGGMPFEQFLQQRVFEPLGMTETTFWPSTEQTQRMAKAYRQNKPAMNSGKRLEEVRINHLTYPLDDRQNRFPEGGGGLFSTPTDWVRFYQMLAGQGVFEGKRILSELSVREIRTKQTGELGESYGLGVAIGGKHFGHGGSHGTDSRIALDRDRIGMYFIQQEGLPKAGEAQNAFFSIVNAK